MSDYIRHREVAFESIRGADLQLDALYKGGKAPDLSAEPLSKLIGVGNQGGFRYIKRGNPSRVCMCALVSSMDEPDWPDSLDIERGIFTYYGDNRTAGNGDMHNTKLGGNKILRDAFNALHTGNRELIPVFLVLTKFGPGRDYHFRGLAVPGAEGLGSNEDLVAIWKSDDQGRRFQNYRARFTILPESLVPAAWINELRNNGEALGPNCPDSWREFVRSGKAKPLTCQRTLKTRFKEEQLPETPLQWELINTLVNYFKTEHPDGEHGFEKCAAELCKMSDSKILELELTPPTRDGGRDGIGIYRLGTEFSFIKVEFFMEAKCYDPATGNGVKLTSRLISRLKNRQYGYWVTTSYVAPQAYQEIVDDGHPVIIFSARDIARILIEHGISTQDRLLSFLRALP
jgi:hypothetical protein